MSSPMLVPAAQYLRTSTGEQPFSIDTQKAAILKYAQHQGFVITKTYLDEGRSGLTLRHRPGLSALLRDVVYGTRSYRAILVYDISRWGRFQDGDEGAHYEFLCRNLNVPVHYCCESFPNNTDLSTFIMKSLKRTIAAESSRELSEKCFRGQKHLVELGYRVGSVSGYGFRRIAISDDTSRIQSLAAGEYKSLSNDHVKLVAGPRIEVETVRRIFARAIAGDSCRLIAKELNRDEVFYKVGRPWAGYAVRLILTNKKYAGSYVWNQTSRRLGIKTRKNSPDQFVVVPNAFPAIVDPAVFEQASKVLHSKSRKWTRDELLRSIDKSGLIAQHTPAGPSLTTLRRRLSEVPSLRCHRGTPLRQGDNPVSSRQRALDIRDRTLNSLLELFEGKISEFHLPCRSRPILRLANGASVSVIVCLRLTRKSGIIRWMFQPVPSESKFVTLIVLDSNPSARYHLVPCVNTDYSCSIGTNHSVLRTGVRLKDLSEFYRAASALNTQTNYAAELAG
jgi:DNA invertase Pin-like site-specific DNA recombinase